MERNILELKMADGSYVIEDHDYGNPLMFVHEQTKDLSDKGFLPMDIGIVLSTSYG